MRLRIAIDVRSHFRQYMKMWLLGKLMPLYLWKSGVLNFGGITTFGAKHTSIVYIMYTLNPLIARILTSKFWYFSPTSTIGCSL